MIASGVNKLDSTLRVSVSSKLYIAVRSLFTDALFDV